MQTWRSYEQVARFLLEQFATHFGLDRVEGKQLVPGASGTDWEIDAKAVQAEGGGFLIVECRRHTIAGLSQESVGGLCYRIQDTGARGGIIVSPLEMHKGAKLIASHEGIQHVQLRADSSNENYLLRFLNSVFVTVTDKLGIALVDSVIVRIVRADGSTEERRTND
jgi:hypothetical protein